METTLTLRNRLGFDDTVLWKQFCAKRLHLIHTLSLNSRKASEQEEQVRSIASDLCSEYGFSSSAQADFEKLIIAGIQSVRRNQKRLQRHANTPSEPDTQQMQNPVQQQQAAISAPPSGSAYSFFPPAVPTGTYSLPQHMIPTLGTAATPGNPLHHPQAGAAHIAAAQMGHQTSQTPFVLSQPPPGHHQPPPPVNSLPSSIISRKLDALRQMVAPYLSLASSNSSAARSGATQIAAEGLLSAAIAGAATHVGSSPTQTQALHVALLAGQLRDALAHAASASNTRLFIDAIGALAASPQGPSLLAALQGVLFELVMAAPDTASMVQILSSQRAPQHLQSVSQACGQLIGGATPSGSATPVAHARMPSPPHSSLSPPSSANGSHFPASHFSMSIQSATPPAAPQSQQASETPSQQTAPQNRGQAVGDQSAQQQSQSQQPQQQPLQPQQPQQQQPQQKQQQQPQQNSPTSGHSIPQQPLVASDRLVTLKFDSKQLQLTYSPLKSTPPTLAEIIDNARHTFQIGAERVVRVKDTQRSKIVETNAELIEAFSQLSVTLEILLPPPMLHDVNQTARTAGFASLAPILQPSAKQLSS